MLRRSTDVEYPAHQEIFWRLTPWQSCTSPATYAKKFTGIWSFTDAQLTRSLAVYHPDTAATENSLPSLLCWDVLLMWKTQLTEGFLKICISTEQCHSVTFAEILLGSEALPMYSLPVSSSVSHWYRCHRKFPALPPLNRSCSTDVEYPAQAVF